MIKTTEEIIQNAFHKNNFVANGSNDITCYRNKLKKKWIPVDEVKETIERISNGASTRTLSILNRILKELGLD